MKSQNPLLGRIHSLRSDEFLILKDAQLQGIRDTVLRLAIGALNPDSIALLSRAAASGKMRDTAGKLLNKKDFDIERSVTKNIPAARKEYAECSAQQISFMMSTMTDERIRQLLTVIFREKAEQALQAMITPALQQISKDAQSIWPKDIVLQILQSRPAPLSAQPDHWREQR